MLRRYCRPLLTTAVLPYSRAGCQIARCRKQTKHPVSQTEADKPRTAAVPASIAFWGDISEERNVARTWDDTVAVGQNGCHGIAKMGVHCSGCDVRSYCSMLCLFLTRFFAAIFWVISYLISTTTKSPCNYEVCISHV